jgi:hypothetical protein
MSAKPTLGYPSRTEAVQGLRRQGLTTRQIAQAIGIENKTVIALEHSSGRKRLPRPAEQMGRTIVFPVDVLSGLQPHAARRGIHVNSLARLIVTTVLDENLVDSVMDDADDITGWDI